MPQAFAAAIPESSAPVEEVPAANEAAQPAASEAVAESAPAEVSAPKAAAEPAAPAAPAKKTSKKAAAAPPEPVAEEPKSDKMDWYILKVQSNREESIREGLMRRVAIAGLGHYFGDAIVPTEKVTEFKGGKKRVIKRKLYPGYLVVQMEINEDTWFLVRETPGIGDFTGASGHPSPMLPHEVARIVTKKADGPGPAPKLKIGFNTGERVKITEGTFENFEGEVDNIDESNGRVTVMINIFGRSTPVELEYWQIEAV
jgi:transcription termination/antitermination protein NusG